MKSYFLHIPKTGGRYLADNVVHNFRYNLIKNGILPSKYMIYGHYCWEPFHKYNEDIFSFSIFRDPVEASISHFCYFNADWHISKKTYFDCIYSGTKKGFELINYQSQFIMADSEKFFLEYYFVDTKDTNLLFERFNSIDIVIPTIKLNRDINVKLLQKNYEIHNLSVPNENRIPHLKRSVYKSGRSKRLYDSLTEQEKKHLYELNSVDNEIYNLAIERFHSQEL